MLDDMFSFIDPIIGIELGDGDTANLVIQEDLFYDFLEKIDVDRPEHPAKGDKIEVPLEIALSLLRPHELEKLQKYVASYLAKQDSNEM
jgi:hypothetical protein